MAGTGLPIKLLREAFLAAENEEAKAARSNLESIRGHMAQALSKPFTHGSTLFSVGSIVGNPV
jgi:hypothetical protein